MVSAAVEDFKMENKEEQNKMMVLTSINDFMVPLSIMYSYTSVI